MATVFLVNPAEVNAVEMGLADREFEGCFPLLKQENRFWMLQNSILDRPRPWRKDAKEVDEKG